MAFAGRANFGDVWGNPGRIDINYAPAGGKSALRNRDLLLPEAQRPGNPSGLVTFRSKQQHAHAVSGTGEKDWLHANSVSYDAARELVLIGINIFCEVWIVDHATSTAVAASVEGTKEALGGGERATEDFLKYLDRFQAETKSLTSSVFGSVAEDIVA